MVLGIQTPSGGLMSYTRRPTSSWRELQASMCAPLKKKKKASMCASLYDPLFPWQKEAS